MMLMWLAVRRMGWGLLLLVSLLGLGACAAARDESNINAQPSGTAAGAVDLPPCRRLLSSRPPPLRPCRLQVQHPRWFQTRFA